MIFAVEAAAAEGGNICADTIRAFLLDLCTAEALLGDGKSRAGMFQATHRQATRQHLSKQKIANAAPIDRIDQQRSGVSHLWICKPFGPFSLL